MLSVSDPGCHRAVPWVWVVCMHGIILNLGTSVDLSHRRPFFGCASFLWARGYIGWISDFRVGSVCPSPFERRMGSPTDSPKVCRTGLHGREVLPRAWFVPRKDLSRFLETRPKVSECLSALGCALHCSSVNFCVSGMTVEGGE